MRRLIWQSEKVIRYCRANIETPLERNCALDLEVRNVLTMLLECSMLTSSERRNAMLGVIEV